MKLQYGMRYHTEGGKITGPLRVNNTCAINYPYYDVQYGRMYAEDGRCATGSDLDKIIGAYYEPVEDREDLPYAVDTVTISRKDYDRLKAIEAFAAEIANLYKPQ
jgi:hypothetical protein